MRVAGLVPWAIVLLLAAVFFRPVSRAAPFASTVFLIVQCAALVLLDSGFAASERVRWIEPPPAIYQFSGVQNVIHIVLDEFQADVFADILQQDRASLDRHLSGFQYFREHSGSFPTTSFSMPAMLASEEYRISSRRQTSSAKPSNTNRSSRRSPPRVTTSMP